MKKKYLSWGNFLKKNREARFRSAREFCAQVPVGISYPQYSRYEAGEQLPALGQALSLCKYLGVPPVEALLEWSQAQVSDPQARGDFAALLENVRSGGSATPSQAGAAGGFSTDTVPLDDVIVFNRSHLRLFSSDPAYRDIFTYINSFGPEWIGAEEIARALGMSQPQTEQMLSNLFDLGVITLERGSASGMRCQASKRNFYFPDDEDFFPLRNLNLTHNASAIMKRLRYRDLADRKAYRGLVTRELTRAQVETVLGQLDQLLNHVVAMPETEKPDAIYSLCVLLGERFSRSGAAGD